MEKTLIIEEKAVKLKTSAAIPRMYRELAKRDIFVDMRNLVSAKKGKKININELQPETLEIMEDLAYCMAKHADPSVPEDPLDWLSQFPTFAVYGIATEAMKMWTEDQRTMSKPKK